MLQPFDATSYTLDVTTKLRPSKIQYQVLVGGEPVKISTAWNDGQPRYVILNYEMMDLKVQYLTASGRLAVDTVDDATIEVINTAWNPGAQNYRKKDTKPAINGLAQASVKLGSLYTTPGAYEPVTVTLSTRIFGTLYDGTMMLVKHYLV